MLAEHRTFAANLHRRTTAGTAETVFPGPCADLRGVAEHLENSEVAFQHELTQALPGAALDGNRAFEHQKVDRLTLEIAYAVLTLHRQVQPVQPASGEHHPIGIQQKTLITLNHSQTARGLDIQNCSCPTLRARH
ncbi:hypothetical protein IBA8403_22350 [Pseudomonas syringae]